MLIQATLIAFIGFKKKRQPTTTTHEEDLKVAGGLGTWKEDWSSGSRIKIHYTHV